MNSTQLVVHFSSRRLNVEWCFFHISRRKIDLVQKQQGSEELCWVPRSMDDLTIEAFESRAAAAEQRLQALELTAGTLLMSGSHMLGIRRTLAIALQIVFKDTF